MSANFCKITYLKNDRSDQTLNLRRLKPLLLSFLLDRSFYYELPNIVLLRKIKEFANFARSLRPQTTRYIHVSQSWDFLQLIRIIMRNYYKLLNRISLRNY